MWRAAVLFSFVVAPAVRAADPVTFTGSIKSILARRCEMCHNAKLSSGKVSVVSRQSLIDSGAVVAGNPDGSLLLSVISGEKPRMPKGGLPLSTEQVNLIRRWIAEGAPDDPGGPATKSDVKTTWWSLRPLTAIGVPQIVDPWVKTPIDAFLLQKLRDHNLSPSPEADRRTLVRRLYFDLLGLPPAPAEIDSFVRDASPAAYERLVRPSTRFARYGERWARHWLDVVHYGDSHGYDKDKPRPNAWPYRDYVIRALNEDKPYARFIQEQIAGDVLYPDDPEAFVATGFLAAGPWDFVGHQELREGTVEKDNTRLLDRDDMVATTISTFNSMTAQCARCHNHKFDPIPQQDYYNLQAVFAGIDRADRPYDEDPAIYTATAGNCCDEKQADPDPTATAAGQGGVRIQSGDCRSGFRDSGRWTADCAYRRTEDHGGCGHKRRNWKSAGARTAKRRQKLVDAIVGPETYAAIEH